jgi:hypothetical protein
MALHRDVFCDASPALRVSEMDGARGEDAVSDSFYMCMYLKKHFLIIK